MSKKYTTTELASFLKIGRATVDRWVQNFAEFLTPDPNAGQPRNRWTARTYTSADLQVLIYAKELKLRGFNRPAIIDALERRRDAQAEPHPEGSRPQAPSTVRRGLIDAPSPAPAERIHVRSFGETFGHTTIVQNFNPDGVPLPDLVSQPGPAGANEAFDQPVQPVFQMADLVWRPDTADAAAQAQQAAELAGAMQGEQPIPPVETLIAMVLKEPDLRRLAEAQRFDYHDLHRKMLAIDPGRKYRWTF